MTMQMLQRPSLGVICHAQTAEFQTLKLSRFTLNHVHNQIATHETQCRSGDAPVAACKLPLRASGLAFHCLAKDEPSTGLIVVPLV